MLRRLNAGSLFQALFFTFIFLLFLSLGVDRGSLAEFRQIFAVIVCLSFLLLYPKEATFRPFQSKAFFFFTCLIIFEMARSLWGVLGLKFLAPDLAEYELYERYVDSSLPWLLYFAIFSVSFAFLNSKKRIKKFLWLVTGSGFFVAMSALPALLQRGRIGYLIGEKQHVFFHPLFYGFKSMGRYVVSDFAHVNYVGDIIAISFFSALGIATYSFLRWVEKRKAGQSVSFPFLDAGVPLSVIGTCSLTIVLLFSRGCILSFLIALTFFGLLMILKQRSRMKFLFLGFIALVLSGFLIWAGNLQSVWVELSTLKQEVGEVSEGSSASNLEGMKRSLRMYKAHPVWGVGVEGYKAMSKQFATPDTFASFTLTRFKAICHYFQILAEEGAGAIFYFFFVALYFLEMIKGFWKSRSRFQTYVGLSLLSSIFMILGHAWISHMMQQFNMAVLVYIIMGASLAVFRPDFEQAS